MQKFHSKDNRIKMIVFSKDKLIETVTSENHEIRLSRYDKDDYERDFLLIITRNNIYNNIYAKYSSDFQCSTINIDINPTWKTQTMIFDYWKINYHLEIVYNDDKADHVLVLSLWNTKEEK